MSGRLAVAVYGDDPITEAGVASQLRGRPEVFVTEASEPHAVDVVMVVVERLGDRAARLLRDVQARGHRRLVVVCAHLDAAVQVRATELGASAVVRRADATPERLSATAVAAAQAPVAPDRRTAPICEPSGGGDDDRNGFTAREIDVLRLLAEGYDTADIADALAYSERTIKNVIHDVTSRLQLRNRSHAVAVAVRTGAI